MSSNPESKLTALESFLDKHPHIKLITPSSPDYASLRAAFSLDNTATPLAIVRPQDAKDVALLVEFVKTRGIPFTIRTGGHNLHGQSIIEGTLSIDMRDIAYVDVDKQSFTAKVGGGVLLAGLAEALAKEGLATPIGTVPSVGYVGWATYGGYGPFSGNFGLGVDQILGARLVDVSGRIVEADEKLLKGIRGAGGIFGVIVELTIKVYSLKTILTGAIFYESQDISATFQKFNVGYQALSAEGLPPQLSLQQTALNTPNGKIFGAAFTWSSEDEHAGRIWLAKIEALGYAVMNTVATSTIPDWLNGNAALVPSSMYGSGRTHSFRTMSTQVTAIIGQSLKNMPTYFGPMFSIHELRGPSAHPNTSSVFATRDPHFMLEILGGAITKEHRNESMEWSYTTWKELQNTAPDNLLSITYISLDPPNLDFPLSRNFGENAGDVLKLKRENDPEDVFNLTVPRLEHLL